MHDQRSLEHSDEVELSPARVSRGTGRVLDLLSVCLKLPAVKHYWPSGGVSSSSGSGLVLSGGSILSPGGFDSNSKPKLSREDSVVEI